MYDLTAPEAKADIEKVGGNFINITGGGCLTDV